MISPPTAGIISILIALAALAHGEAAELKIDDGGRTRVFDHHPVRAHPQEGRARSPSATNEPSPQTSPNDLILVERGQPGTPYSERRLTEKVLVQFSPGADAHTAAQAVNASHWAPVAAAPDYFIFFSNNAAESLDLCHRLQERPGVLYAQPLLGKRYRRKSPPNDPLFPLQWHLKNTGQSGGTATIDVNALSAWTEFTGLGTVVGVVDDGVDWRHPDLIDTIDLSLSYDYRDGDADPRPSQFDDGHGTCVAGLIGARGGNGIGVSGVAPLVKLAAIRLIGGDTTTDWEYSDALLHERDTVQVYNNSWGPDDTGDSLEAPGLLSRLALERGAWTGRGGRGAIYVFTAGNGGDLQENANYDGFANSIYTITVGAVNDRGLKPSYSEPGACLITCAPSDDDFSASGAGLVTTDITGPAGWNFGFDDLDDDDYTQLFGGTSGAAPLVSGVIALMLEANPNLGWRDVQEILIRSARKIQPSAAEWRTNSAGFHFNPDYGAGLVDATAATALAESWNNLSLHTNIILAKANIDLAIPDNDPAGATLIFSIDTESLLRVEHAVMTVDIPHDRRGDLKIELISPDGTISPLAEKHLDPNPDYPLWPLMSVFHWGEMSAGEWRLRISDLRPNQTGRLNYAKLELFGTEITPLRLMAARATNGGLRLTVQGPPMGEFELDQSNDLSTWDRIQKGQLNENGHYELELFAEELGEPASFFRLLQTP